MVALDLTVKNGGNTPVLGFGKKRQNVTEADVQRAFKKALTALRKHANTRGCRSCWKCVIYAVTSQTHLSQGGIIGAWHVHALIFGLNATAIAKWIKAYWIRHCWGLPSGQLVKTCWNGGKVEYIEQQKCHSFCQIIGVTDADAKAWGFGSKANIKRETVRKIFPSYLSPKNRTNVQTGYPFSITL